MSKAKVAASTPFSDFFRNAPAEQTKRVYQSVLQRSTERQLKVLAAAATHAG